ncbi:hypothetical protein ABL78_5424 [Leptomonas seymouri]|uniref:Uncharacterized protein n=1 Tax=Leptomonas seymouri TaxID=5684 RepID=A0A0N1PBK8_LEPSE|nr:hypothetical protein ABL78_5424 [Leptomonas seymouri]|eukprot:KPI85504.1 hypothetical protein ABL78_5424 [Leptomonas seymouri]
MIPSNVLCRLASRAASVFAVPSPTASPLSQSPQDFQQLVSCTRSLVLLTKTPSRNEEDARLVGCLQQCADHTLDALRQLPASADLPSGISVVLFGILRSSVGFWDGDRSAQLAQQLTERVDPFVLRTWRPRTLLAAVHAIAKACPSQAHLSLLSDVLALLHHQEAKLSERDVAMLLWCMAVLHVAEAQEPMWRSLCKLATLHFDRMNAVSRLTLSQALLLQHTCLCEAQVELLQMVHRANCELDCDGDAVGDAQRRLYRSGSQRGGQRRQLTAHFYSESNTHNSRTIAPSLLTSQLLQYTTHTLSDETLVRLLLTLFNSNSGAADELLLVLAHLTQRMSLSERLCVQVLCFAQRYASSTGDNATAPTDLPCSLPSPASVEMSVLVWRARQHAKKLLVRSVRAGLARAPREVAETLCLEHCYDHGGSSGVHGPKCATTELLPPDAVWDAMTGVLSKTFGRGATLLHSLGGSELWSWQCIRAYVRTAKAASTDGSQSLSASSTEKDERQVLDCLDVYSDVQRCWTSARERQGHCVELIVAAAQSSGTQLLAYADALHSSDALQLLEACVREVQAGVSTLPVATTLRLLSAIDEALSTVSPVVHTLQPSLLSQLESHAARTSGVLPGVVQYLSNTLARDAGNSSSDDSGAVVRHSAHPRVSDAVLDVFVRLLVQEHQRTLSAMQSNLLMRCMQERQGRPAFLVNAFMLLMTRRLGQSAAFLNATTLPTEAMCSLVELANGLPRAQVDATATATRTLILTTLLDVLVQRSIPECVSADGLVAACLLLRLDVVGELQRVQEMAAALDARSAALLRRDSAAWTPTQRAYVIAALVCAQVVPSPALLHALHEEDHVPKPAQVVDDEEGKSNGE